MAVKLIGEGIAILEKLFSEAKLEFNLVGY
jgi:hypothetical protein